MYVKVRIYIWCRVEVQTLQSKVEALTKDKNVSDSDHESRVQVSK